MLRDTLGRRASDNDDPALAIMTGTVPTNTTTTHHENPQHSNPNLNEDIFGSAPSSPVLLPTNPSSDNTRPAAHPRDDASRIDTHTHPSDIPRLRSQHITAGYREGIAASKEQYIQEGFDEGFSLGGEIGQKAGIILGVLEGVVRGLHSRRRGAEGRDDGAGIEGDSALREEVEGMYAEAKEELTMERLLGREWFGGDGVWLWGSEGEDEGEDVTFEIVAGRHPVLVRWKARVRGISQRLGLRLELEGNEEEVEKEEEA